MSSVKSYEEMWHFWVDDCCYRIAREQAYLGIAGEVTLDFFEKNIENELPRLESHHGVLIRGVEHGFVDVGVEIQVAKYGWVFDLIDYGRFNQGRIEDIIYGVMLGYSPSSIDAFINSRKMFDEI